MDRAEFLRKAGAGAAGLALAATAPVRPRGERGPEARTSGPDGRPEGRPEGRPNVLLIMTDDQPYHTVRAMGSLRRNVVEKGMSFGNAYVATPVCGPARGSVLTGQWSHNTGLQSTTGAWRELVDSGELPRNIAGRLREAGYACHLSGKFTNDLRDGGWVGPGFDSWWAQLEPLNDPDRLFFSAGGDGRRTLARTAAAAGNETLVAAGYTETFLRNHRDTPWFACYWPHAPHGPYYPLKKYAGTHRGQKPPTPFGEPERDLSDKAPPVRRAARFSDAAEAGMMREYRGALREVEEVDLAVDRLLGALAETGQLERTWVFFLTDNGYQHGEHFLEKKLWPYEESTRTPFVVRGPGVRAGSTNGHLVSQVDLLPTICELAGADAGGVDGRSLLPILREPEAPFREFLLIEAEAYGWHAVRMRRRGGAGTDHDDRLFVRWRGGFEELYDYGRDPGLYDGRAGTARERAEAGALRERLLAMHRAAGDGYRALETG